MDDRRVALATIAATAVAFVARYTPGYLMTRWADGFIDGPSRPPFGTAGESVMIASHAVDLVEVTAPLAIGVGLGLMLSQRISEIEQALRTVAKTGVAVVVLVAVGAFLFTGADPIYVLALGVPVYAVCLLVVVGAIAGAGVDRLNLVTSDGDPAAETEPVTANPPEEDTTRSSA